MIESSPQSAESNFRELDEVFLQTQTRIWIGEVVNTRFDEDLHLSDLLQDGDILFEVSKVVWNLLLTKCMELRHLKHKYGPFGSRRSSGRYRPYSNVDAFIKTCKILGLSGIDLFSPSDVVEKRDIRKVCICIRALSKKARSKQLSVPDFDMVICSVTMPTNMVGVIRKSLESSQCTLSSSSSYSSRKVCKIKRKQKQLYAPSNEDDCSSSSEKSDEAESRYMGENSFSSAGKFDYADGVNSDLENSPEGQCIQELKHELCKPASLTNKTVQSFSQHQLENDYSVVGDSSCVDVGESNYISDYLAFSDLMVHTTDGSNSVIRNGESNMFDFFLNVHSQGLSSDKRSFENGSQKKYCDDDDMEISSTTSMSSVLGRLLNMEFEDQFDEDDSLSANVQSSISKEHDEAEKHCKDLILSSESPKVDIYETNYQTVLFDSPEARNKCELSNLTSDELKSSCNSISVVASDNEQLHNINGLGFSSQHTTQVVLNETKIHSSAVQLNLSETSSDTHSCLPVKDMNGAREDIPVVNNVQDSISCAVENGSQDESISEGRKVETSLRRRPLLRTVVKGTAIAGVLFLLLHISRKSNGNNAQETKPYVQESKFKGSRLPFRKQQKGSVAKGVYPARKLKL